MTGLLYCLPLTSSWLQIEDSDTQQTLQECLNYLNEDKQPLILYGKENCGKTVFLFQAGVAYANQDYHVTLISRRPLSRMPLAIHGMIRPDAAGKLHTLTFLYMSKVSDLIDYCCSIHSKTVIPDVLIIDDLDFYLGHLSDVPDVDVGCAKLSAILTDTLSYIQTKSSVGVLLAGCNNKHTEWKLVLSHFKFTIADITVKEQQHVKDQEQQYSLHVETDKVSLTVGYQINKSGVYLVDVSANCSKT